MLNTELESLLNTELNSNNFNDYAPNGLQVEGCSVINRIITGVTACQSLLDQAVKLQADAVLVHHGYFWKNESPIITGMKRKRLKTLLSHDINLFAYHLPLDAHPQLGNNVQLAQKLAINIIDKMDDFSLYGYLSQPMAAETFQSYLIKQLNCHVLHCGDNAPMMIQRIGWSSGGGQDYINLAVNLGLDAFITGEVSERTIHIAREEGLHFFSIGHHNSEKYGIEALGKWLKEKCNLDVFFIDIPNPA